MKDDILSNMHDPGKLEKLYRVNKANFKQEFRGIYPRLKGNLLADFWQERLSYDSDEVMWGSKKEFLFVALMSLVAGLLAKLPALFPISEEFFYPRNASFVIFPMVTAYFAWKNKLTANKLALISGIVVVCLLYINFLPGTFESDTLLLACIHLPLLLWGILGVSFVGNELDNPTKHLDFLRFNGELVVMSALLVLAGMLMTGVTIGLFGLIGFQIEEFYFEYVVVFGLPAVPILGTYLTRTNPQLVNKVSPVIAQLFSPLVLIMLIIYVGAIIFSGKDPYNDREFLLLFNLLLIGVMALIFFSVAERSTPEKSVFGRWVLLLLSIVTVIVNGIALSAISYRISEWGITPNRVAVLGGNILILIHLLIVTAMLFKASTRKAAITEVGRYIVRYLPVYFIWAIVVIFTFPLIFSFK